MIPVDSIRANGFMKFEDYALDLPERGAVLIEGANGQGKSSAIDMVCWALWGKTTRGKPPWPLNDAGKVEIDTSVSVTAGGKHGVTRLAKKGRPKALSHRIEGDEVTEAGTVTKAQEALDPYIGSMSTWRRCHVFSVQDTDAFTRATDAERKRLIEALLGLDKFDAAYKQLSSKAKDLEAEERSLEAEINWEQGRLQEAKAALRELLHSVSDVAPAVDVELLQRRLSKARKKLQASTKLVDALNADIRDYQKDIRTRRMELSQEEAREQLLSDGRCPTCHADIDADALHAITGSVDDLAQSVAEEEYRLQEIIDENLESLEEARAIKEDCEDLIQDLPEKIADARVANTRREGLEDQIQQKTAEIASLEDRMGELESTQAGVRLDLDTYATAAKVCSIKGVRASLLSKALAALEFTANTWVQEFSNGRMSLKLGVSEKGDKILLEVIGAGGGHGYEAVSTGEGQRINIALVLGLAQMAASASGQTPGPLWLDEVFKGIDTEGLDAIGGMINDIAANRCVVVISHNPLVREVVDFAQHYRIDNHTLRRIA